MNVLKFQIAKALSSTPLISNFTKLPRGRRVLMYHSIQDSQSLGFDFDDTYALSLRYFKEHVNVFREVETPDHQVVALHDSLSTGISITFDDGYKDTFTTVAPMLCENKIPFHTFVTPARILSNDNKFMTPSELVALSQMPGVVIGGHGYSHIRLDTLSERQVRDELTSGKEWIENLIGKEVLTMSYPHGAINASIEEIVKTVGYKFAATSKWGTYKPTINPLSIPRLDIWNHDSGKTLKQKINGKWDWLQRFN